MQADAPETFARYKAAKENSFLVFTTNGLDGAKVGTLDDKGKKLAGELDVLAKAGSSDKNLEALQTWWTSAQETASADEAPVKAATLHGSRMALKLTAIVPAIMAVCYIILILYFKSIGGYKPVYLDGEKMTGGVQGPMEA